MGELQKLYVALALDAADYEKGLRDAEGQAQGFGGRVTGALTSVGRVGGAALLGVGALAAGGFGMAMNSAIQMNAQLETSTLQFTTLMGDSDKAQAHVRALFDFAANTPFETQPIIDASLKLQTFGGEALNTTENMALVGDAAAAVGAPIDEVAFWVGRLYSNLQAGQPFGEAAMRLQELGIMAPEARAQLEGMQASGATGTEIFAAFQGQLGTFSGAMEAQSGTWSGLTSTIRDQIGLLTAETLKPFFDLLKEGLGGMAQWLASPEVQAGIQTLAGHIKTLAAGVQDFVIGKVVPFVRDHGPQLKQILIALAAAFGGLLIIGAVAAAIAVLTNPITWVALAVGALAAAWATNWGGIRDKTEAVVGFLRSLIENALARIRQWWQEHGDGIVAAARKAWELIQGVIDGVVRQIQLIVEGFRAAFSGDWERFGEIIFELWKNAWDTVVEFLSGLWEMVQPWLAGLWESIKRWFTETDWKQLGENIIDGIVNGLNAAGAAIVETIKGFAMAAWDEIKSFFGIKSPSTLMFWAGQMIVQGFVDGVRSMTADVVETVDVSLLEPVREMLDEMSGLMEFGGKAGGIAGGFANVFESRVIGPMETQMESLGEQFEAQRGWYERGLQLFMPGAEALDFDDPRLLDQLRLMRDIAIDSGYENQLGPLNRLLSTVESRNGLEDEYIRQQEKLLALEKARADLDFLKQQMDLLALMNENNIPLSLLQGVTLGLGADPGQLMGIMVDVMDRIARDASLNLSQLTQPPAGVVTTPAGGTAMSVQNQTINGGQHLYFYDSDESQLEILEILSR